MTAAAMTRTATARPRYPFSTASMRCIFSLVCLTLRVAREASRCDLFGAFVDVPSRNSSGNAPTRIGETTAQPTMQEKLRRKIRVDCPNRVWSFVEHMTTDLSKTQRNAHRKGTKI